MDRVEQVFEELNYPSLKKLKATLDRRNIPYNQKDVEKLVRSEASRQVQAPAYKFQGKIPAHGINVRWFADLIDFTAAPSDRGKKTGLRKTDDGEVYILVVQDVFSRFLWKEALTPKRPDVVLEGFRAILRRAGAKPQSLTTDQGT